MKGDKIKTINTIQAWKAIRDSLEGSVGLVPTMGALHKGHAALINKSKEENDTTVVSIFVNPLQFNDSTDYGNYPSSLSSDKEILEAIGVDYLFLPQKAEMISTQYTFTVDIDHPQASVLEGKYRPGHFNGVLTIVLKLLNGISPHKAYFGEKDYQQYLLIKEMAADLFLHTEIIPCKTVREKSSLPYSSRNALLSADDKVIAECASKVIHQVKRKDEVISDVINKLIDFGVNVEYLTVKDGRVYSATTINSIRLIDNFSILEEDAC